MTATTPFETKAHVVERVQEALLASPTSAELATLRAEAENMLRGMREAEADCRTQSLNPSNSVAEARTARHTADDFAHESLRLQAAIATIDQVLPDVLSAEHQAAIRPVYEVRKAEHEALVARIRKEWPALTAKMIDLLDAIDAFRQAPGVEIPQGENPLREDVEAEARGCDSSFYAPPYPGAGVAPLKRLRDSQIVRFQPSAREDERMAWPRYRRHIG